MDRIPGGRQNKRCTILMDWKSQYREGAHASPINLCIEFNNSIIPAGLIRIWGNYSVVYMEE